MNSLKSIIDSRLDFVKHFTDKSYCVCKKCGSEWETTIKNGVKKYNPKEFYFRRLAMIERLNDKLKSINEKIEEKSGIIRKEKQELDDLLKQKEEIVNRKTYLEFIQHKGLYGRIIGEYLQNWGHQPHGYGDYYVLINDEVYLHGRLGKKNGECFWEETQHELDAYTMRRFFDENFIIKDLEKWKSAVISYEKGDKVEYEDINGKGLLKFKYE